jgi:hypothetical protein
MHLEARNRRRKRFRIIDLPISVEGLDGGKTLLLLSKQQK